MQAIRVSVQQLVDHRLGGKGHRAQPVENHRGVPGFGACGVHIFDSQVIEDLYQVRAVFPRLFPADECDKHVSAKKDTTERCAPLLSF